MQNSEALTIILALADGLNPSSEEPCGSESILRHPRWKRPWRRFILKLSGKPERDRSRPTPANPGSSLRRNCFAPNSTVE
jgi:hypothetical protein